MANLMTDTCTYDSLVNKYGNFHVPAICLKVDGSDTVRDLSLNIQSLEISLSLSEASTAVVRLGDVYDSVNRSFYDKIKDKFKLGKIVEVGIGYDSELQTVLKGYIDTLGAEFGENTSLIITIKDVRQLMISGGVHHVLHHVEHYSDAVNTILGGYSVLCTAEIDATEEQLVHPVSQKSSDYDFITRELIGNGRCNREFLVVGEKAYFRKTGNDTTAICSMEFGRELRKFQMESSYADLQVNVIGYDQQTQTVITATATAKSTEEQSSLMSETPVWDIVDPEADTQDKADLRAKAYADKRISLGQQGSGVCIGLPELIPGRYVEITMLEDMVNKKYYIVHVTHKIDEEGFVTEFTTGGWI
ncbi:MAG: phage late control D family protein [Lachnospiraceae bacterium]|nr:phage late control D family protein [Lachnospiraceae bacterium]